jgi:hypothetical protein
MLNAKILLTNFKQEKLYIGLHNLTLPISALPAGIMQHPFYTGQENVAL